MTHDISDELRMMHATLAACPRAFGELCLRCRAAREIERLTHEVRVLSRMVAEFMSEEDQTALSLEIAKMFEASEDNDDVVHDFWD
jgi:5-carboxymethyl-2-hydroxymuconate isomerase